MGQATAQLFLLRQVGAAGTLARVKRSGPLEGRSSNDVNKMQFNLVPAMLHGCVWSAWRLIFSDCMRVAVAKQ